MNKCSTVRIKKGKICDMEDIKMPDGKRMKQIQESGYRYLGIFQDSEIKDYCQPTALLAGFSQNSCQAVQQ